MVSTTRRSSGIETNDSHHPVIGWTSIIEGSAIVKWIPNFIGWIAGDHFYQGECNPFHWCSWRAPKYVQIIGFWSFFWFSQIEYQTVTITCAIAEIESQFGNYTPINTHELIQQNTYWDIGKGAHLQFPSTTLEKYLYRRMNRSISMVISIEGLGG